MLAADSEAQQCELNQASKLLIGVAYNMAIIHLPLAHFPPHNFDTFPLHICTFSPTCLTLLPPKK